MNEIGNGIGYFGEVTAKLTKNDNLFARIHNSGTKHLWDTLAMAVVGMDISEKIPFNFCIYKRKPIDDVRYDEESCLFSKILFLGSVWGDVVETSDDRTVARFTASVTARDRLSTINPSEIAVLKMFNKDGELLAEIQDNIDRSIAAIHNSMITGVDAVYEWKMIFKNVSVNEGGNS